MSQMPDYDPDSDDGDAGLIDEKAIQDILEKATDALRSLGLTIRTQDVTLTIQQGQTFALIPALIRPSAKKKLTEDREAREEFNKMMAADNEARIKGEAQRFRDIANDPVALEAFLYGNESEQEVCAHENIHEGLCLDCGEEISD